MSLVPTQPAISFKLDGVPITLDGHLPYCTTGAFCDIFTGQHPVIGKVALKRPRIAGGDDVDRKILSFLREASIWKGLSHRNILPFTGAITLERHIWLISPFASNGPLPDYVKRNPNVVRYELISQLAQGISYLHGRKIIHGDIKGTNVLVSEEGKVLVCDFGLSRMTDVATSASIKGVGNARWQAPELLEVDDASKTFATDVYAFGITIYEVLTGRIPFDKYNGGGAVINAVCVRNERPEMTPFFGPSGESFVALWAFADLCWKRDPQQRPTMEVISSSFEVVPLIASSSDERQSVSSHVTSGAYDSSCVTALLVLRHLIIFASDNRTIKVWSSLKRELVMTLPTGTGVVWAMAASSRRLRVHRATAPSPYLLRPDNKSHHEVLVAGSTIGTAHIWDLHTGKNTHIFAGHSMTIGCLAIARPTWITSPDGYFAKQKWPKHTMIVTGSYDKTLRIWRLPGPEEKEYRSYVTPWMRDEAYLDDSASINPYHKIVLRGHCGDVSSVAVHGRTVVSGSNDKTVRVWDLVNGTCTFTMMGHTGKVWCVVIDPIRQQTCSASLDCTIRIWSLKNGSTLHVLSGHTASIGYLSLSRTTLVSGSADSTLRVWDLNDGRPLARLVGHTGPITFVKHDEEKVLSAAGDTLKTWDLRNGCVARDLLAAGPDIWHVALDDYSCVVARSSGRSTNIDTLNFNLNIAVPPDSTADSDDEDGSGLVFVRGAGEGWYTVM